MILNNVYQKYNFARRPDWRWERVLRMVDREPTPGRTTKRDDDYIRRTRNFIMRWRHRSEEEREPLFYEEPGLYLAYQMYEEQMENPDAALILQARLLTAMPFADIAEAMSTHPSMVEMYEAVFFNVRDKLKARDWITQRVLMPSMMRNFGLFTKDEDDDAVQPSPWQNQVIAKPFMDASLKMFAYFGGQIVCEFMIAGFQQGKICQSTDALSEWFDGHWAMTVKARSAQAARTFEVNKYNVMELFATHARIMEIEKSVDSTEQKRNSIEKHVGALIGELQDVWGVEDDGSALDGTDVLKYDAGAAELRDDELIIVAAGGKVEQTGLEKLLLPPPKPKEVKDDKK